MFLREIGQFVSNPTFHIQDTLENHALVTPKEYCDKWVFQKTGIHPESRGYNSACVRELSSVLGLSKIAIRKWGKDFENHPDYIRVSLGNVDKLNDIAKIVARRQLNHHYI
ncbi:MAG: hypothetical protein NW214_13345 [Pseudanabaenaceae cyanobacterium bins.39]|nr:hypothetical protein [Pseudanabaenaceae cyanobacterium bins.39]